MRAALCVPDSSKELYSPERRLHLACHVCVESRDAGIREASIFLSLSPFSFRFTHVHLVALVNIFLLLARRNDSLYTRCIARERARTVTYGHARSLTHSRGPIHMPYIKECIPHSGEDGDERREEGRRALLFPRETNFVSARRKFARATTPTALTVRWQIAQFSDTNAWRVIRTKRCDQETLDWEGERDGGTETPCAFEKYCIGRPAAIYHAFSRLKFAWYCF